jgi:hypothetical protein
VNPRALRPLQIAGAFGLALGVCACGSSSRDPPCPKIFLAQETSTLTKFRAGGRDITDVQFEAELLGYSGGCKYDKAKLTIELNVDMAVTRGPVGGREARFEYFVAVPKLYPNPAGKQDFDVAFVFPQNARRGQFRDEIVLEFALADRNQGPSNEIYIGFQLTEAELDYNRKRRER